jgi:hypothetical protein
MKYSIKIGERIYLAEIVDLDARPVVVMVDGQAIEVWPEMDASLPGTRTADPLAVASPGSKGLHGSAGQAVIPASRALEKTLRARSQV